MEQPKKPTVVADLLPEQEKPKIESLPREEKDKGSNVESIPSEPVQKGDNSTVLPLPEEDTGNIVTVEENSGENIIFGGESKSKGKLEREMVQREWTKDDVKDTVDNPFTTRQSTNKANGNDATAYYNEDGSYVVVDNVTHEVIQVSGDRENPKEWIPDAAIKDPYMPWE